MFDSIEEFSEFLNNNAVYESEYGVFSTSFNFMPNDAELEMIAALLVYRGYSSINATWYNEQFYIYAQ